VESPSMTCIIITLVKEVSQTLMNITVHQVRLTGRTVDGLVTITQVWGNLNLWRNLKKCLILNNMIPTFLEFINENISVKSFQDFTDYNTGDPVSPDKIIERLKLLDYDGELDSASIKKWLYDTYNVRFICVESKSGGYAYFFTILPDNKFRRKTDKEKYDKTKEICYIISEYDYQKEDYMFMENLLEGLDWLIEILYNPDNPDFEHSIVEDPIDYTQYYKK